MKLERQARRFVRWKACLLAAHSCAAAAAVGLALLGAVVVVDGIFALSAVVRDWCRWLVLASVVMVLAISFLRQMFLLRLNTVLADVERRLGFAHDPIRNALDLQKIPLGSGLLTEEFIGREILRTTALLQDKFTEVSSLFGWRDWMRSLTPAVWGGLLGGPSLMVAVGVLTQAEPSLGARRILRPYEEIERLGAAIFFEPKPGEHQVLKGSAVDLKMTVSVPAPKPWGLPIVDLGGEERRMILLDDQAGRKHYFFGLAALADDLNFSLRWGEFKAGPWIFKAIEPPAIKSLMIAIAPPRYSKKPSKILENPSMVDVLQGSRLSFDIVSNQRLIGASVIHENDSGILESKGPVAPMPDGRAKIDLAPRQSGRLRVALDNDAGMSNAEAWMITLNVLEDKPPRVTITDPVFHVIQMDVDEDLEIAWIAEDDLGVIAVDMVIGQAHVKALKSRRRLWSGANAPKESIRDTAHFRPSSWSLKAGDEVLVAFEGQDAMPGRPEPEPFSDVLYITIKNFEQTHQQNLEQRNDELKEALMKHLEKGLALQGEMTGASSDTARQMTSPIDAYENASRKLERQLRDYAKELGEDPLARPSWSWGVEAVAQTLDSAASSHLNPAKNEARQGRVESSREEMARYVEQTEKAVEAFDELRKEQKMQDAVFSASRLDEIAERINQSLENFEDAKELQEALEALDREMQELAQAMSQMNPQEYPQEFVNQVRPEDVPLQQAAQARAQLADALRQGDFKRAAQKAREMAGQIKKMRQELEEAAQAQESKFKDRLGGAPGEDGEQPSLAQDLEALRQDQERLLWKSSALERSIRIAAAEQKASIGQEQQPVLSDADRQSAGQLAQEQNDLAGRTKKLLDEFAGMDREFPQLVLGSKINKLEAVLQDQHQAREALDQIMLSPALEKESAALQKMQELGEALSQMAQHLAESSMPAPGSKGRSRPIVFVPAPGASSREGGPGDQGIRVDRVMIPRPEDYKVPEGSRKEILRSLRDRRPDAQEDAVGEYLRNLLK
ncbi:MAG: hypothetical protein HY547_01830 [Elusimicrobia bacterium]|nr:hypothetical protein [Elusimicrobiota bacterium]